MKKTMRKIKAIIFAGIVVVSSVGNPALRVYAAEEEIGAEALAEAAAAEAAAQAEAAQAAAEAAAQEAAAQAAAEAAAQEAAAQAAAEAAAQEAAAQAAAEAAAQEAAAQAAAEAAAQEAAAQAAAEAAAQEAAAKAAAEAPAVITLSYKAAEGGRVSIEKEDVNVAAPAVQGATAVAHEGYAFSHWTNERGQTIDKAEAKFVPVFDGAAHVYTAHFSKAETSLPAAEVKEEQKAEEEQEEAKEEKQETVTEENKAEEKEETKEETTEEKTNEEKKEAEEEEEVKYPAAKWSGETADVRVYASVGEGVFPEGTEMMVFAVSSASAISAAQDMVGEKTEVVDAVAADITFRYEGSEIQPQGAVSVRLTAKRKIEGESHNAVTIDDHGHAAPVADASAHTSSFDTDHFTVYGIYGGNYADEDVTEYVRHIYQFFAGDPNAEISTWEKIDEQILRDGAETEDQLELPPALAGSSRNPFLGWFVVEGEGDSLAYTDTEITDGPVTVSPAFVTDENEEVAAAQNQKIIRVYAKYDSLYQVTLYTDSTLKSVYETYLEANGNTVPLPTQDTIDESKLDIENGYAFTGWVEAGREGDGTKESVTIDGADIELHPVFEEVKTVKFVINPLGLDGVTNENPKDQYILPGKCAEAPAGFEPGVVIDGYKLEGWYSAAPEMATGEYDEDAKWKFSDKVDKNLTLYAKWEAQEVSYKVIVMQEVQNPAGNGSDASDFAVWSQIPEKEMEGKPGTAVDIQEALSYVDKYRKPDTNGSYYDSTYHYHLSGTGAKNGSAEYYTAVVEHNGTPVAYYSTNSGWEDENAAVVSGDGNTVVRVYMCRNTYTLQFLFRNTCAKNANIDAYGVYGGTQVSQDYENDPDLPAGGNLAGLNYEIRYRENMYGNIYYPNTDVQSLMAGPWKINRRFGFDSGQTRFDITNKTYNVVHVGQNVGDGDTIYLVLEYKENKVSHPFHFYRADAKGNFTKYDEKVIPYFMEAGEKHPHQYTIGSVNDGYKLVKICTGSVTYSEENHNINSDNRYVFEYYYDDDGNYTAYPMELYYEPVAHTITFHPNDGGNEFDAQNTNGDTKFYNGEDYSFVVNKDRPAGDERYQKGYQEMRNGVLFEFGGWYDNAALDGDAYDFTGNTMENADLHFYGKWVPVQCKVVFHPENGDDIWEQTVTIGQQKATRPANPQKEGTVFTGWYYKDKDGNMMPYDFNMVLDKEPVDSLATEGEAGMGTAKIHLYADYSVPGPFAIVYDAAANGGTLSEALADQLGTFTLINETEVRNADPKTYRAGASAPVKGSAEKKDYVFAGWRIGKNEAGAQVVKDGGSIPAGEMLDALDGSSDLVIRLYAIFEKIERVTSVTYHTNFPAGDGSDNRDATVDGLVVNGVFTVLNPADRSLEFPTRYTAADGSSYTFAGWTTNGNAPKLVFDADDESEYFKPGDAVAAGKEKEENHLYAVWNVVQEPEPEPDPEPEPTPPTPPTPPVPPTPPTPPTPPEIPAQDPEDVVTPLPDPELPAVLGQARRTTVLDTMTGAQVRNYDEPDVLGSRRGKTGETADATRMMTTMAAAIVLAALAKDRKRKSR